MIPTTSQQVRLCTLLCDVECFDCNRQKPQTMLIPVNVPRSEKSNQLIMGKKRYRIESVDTYLLSTTLPLAKPMANILSGSGLGYQATV